MTSHSLTSSGGADSPSGRRMPRSARATASMRCPSSSRIIYPSIHDLSPFLLSSFAGGIAGVTSGLPLGFQGGFPRYLLREFRIAGRLLGFQHGLASGHLG